MTSRLRWVQLLSLGGLLAVLGTQVWQGLSSRVPALPAVQLVVVAMGFGLTLANHRRRGLINEAAGWIVLCNVALIYAFNHSPGVLEFAAALAAVTLLGATLYKPGRAKAVKS